MKKLYILLSLCFSIAVSFAQHVPQGMKYQAVARNIVGNIIANQEISLKINLVTMQGNNVTVYYSEVHTVTTNALGLFSITIGGGKVDKGTFASIPWSSADIWMQVAIKDKGKADFVTVSNSKLLAVPYAFHSETANTLVGNTEVPGSNIANVSTSVSNSNSPGVPAQVWSLKGNSGVDPTTDRLGTTDFADLVLITNNTERLRILANGNIELKRSLKIGADLNVDSSAYLNKVKGQTINYGPFTVSRKSPTRLTGDLTVDSGANTLLSGKLTVDGATDLNNSLNVDGVTDLNSRLNVNNKSETHLSGSLNVKGVTDLDSSLNVNGKNASVLTGTLRVDSAVVFNSPINSDTSAVAPSGGLAIYGGVGILKNLTVGGDTRLGGKTSFAGSVRISDGTEYGKRSDGTDTAALIVGGGVGIGKKLNVGGNANFVSNMAVAGSTTLAGLTTINNVLTVNADNGQVNIIGGTSGADTDAGAYPLKVTGKSQGVFIKLTGTGQASSANNFVTFEDNGKIRGRIEGQTQDDLENESRYKNDVLQLEIAIATATATELKDGATLIGALTATTPCVGLGVCETVPPVSPIVAATANLVVSTARLVATVLGLTKYKDDRSSTLGVTYASNGADYAEWLPKSKPSDFMVAGEVVGVTNGLISRTTAGAEKVMVISTNPIVLGNLSSTGKNTGLEKVAFMGQVPVRVFGKVKLGDYILSSGMDNGFGRAKSPDQLTAADYQQVVGIAWTASDKDGASMINVAVGFVSGGNKLLQKQEEKITSLSNEINEMKAASNKTNEMLAKLIPGFKNPNANVESNTALNQEKKESTFTNPFPVAKTDASGKWIYRSITDVELEDGIKLAEKMLNDKGISTAEDPFFKSVRTNPAYKATFMSKFREAFDKNAKSIQDSDKSLMHN